jgi:hypothetical protein
MKNETREEEEVEERRRIAVEGSSTYAYGTTTMKRIFFFSFSLDEIFSTKKKEERMLNSISILFHFLSSFIYS